MSRTLRQEVIGQYRSKKKTSSDWEKSIQGVKRLPDNASLVDVLAVFCPEEYTKATWLSHRILVYQINKRLPEPLDPKGFALKRKSYQAVELSKQLKQSRLTEADKAFCLDQFLALEAAKVYKFEKLKKCVNKSRWPLLVYTLQAWPHRLRQKMGGRWDPVASQLINAINKVNLTSETKFSDSILRLKSLLMDKLDRFPSHCHDSVIYFDQVAFDKHKINDSLSSLLEAKEQLKTIFNTTVVCGEEGRQYREMAEVLHEMYPAILQLHDGKTVLSNAEMSLFKRLKNELGYFFFPVISKELRQFHKVMSQPLERAQEAIQKGIEEAQKIKAEGKPSRIDKEEKLKVKSTTRFFLEKEQEDLEEQKGELGQEMTCFEKFDALCDRLGCDSRLKVLKSSNGKGASSMATAKEPKTVALKTKQKVRARSQVYAVSLPVGKNLPSWRRPSSHLIKGCTVTKG